MKFSKLSFLILFSLSVSIFAIKGCSSSSNDSQPRINQAVSMEIFSYLMAELMFVGFESGLTLSDDIAHTAIKQLNRSLPDDYSATVNCSGGGSMSQTGSVTDNLTEEGTGTIETTIVQTISNCGISTSQGLFVVNGNPNLSSWGTMEVESWNPLTFEFTFEGGYTWQGANQSGECSMSITQSLDMQNPANFSMSGHMCGYTY